LPFHFFNICRENLRIDRAPSFPFGHYLCCGKIIGHVHQQQLSFIPFILPIFTTMLFKQYPAYTNEYFNYISTNLNHPFHLKCILHLIELAKPNGFHFDAHTPFGHF